MNLKWMNKTPHTVRRIDAAGEVLAEYPPADFPVRARQPERLLYVADQTVIKRYVGHPVFKGLPEPIRDDTIYIVSGIAAALIKRWNFVSPNTGPASVKRKDQDTFAVRSFTTFGDLPNDAKGRVGEKAAS